MKKSRYNEEQIVRILRETDCDTVAEVAKRHGVSEASIYVWQKKFSAMECTDVKRLKALESENSRLKKILAERDLEIEVMKKIAAKKSVQARREQARYAIERGLSHRRACALLRTSRSNLGYTHKMPTKDGPIIAAMKILSGTYPRFGSRRIRVFLQRMDILIGKEKCSRLWAKADLQVPKKRRRKITGKRLRPLAPTERNSVWSYDFVYDACANGQKLKCLTVIDEYTRECLAIDVSRAIRSLC